MSAGDPPPMLVRAPGPEGTALVLVPVPGLLPRVAWFGPEAPGLDAEQIATAVGVGSQPATVRHATGRSVSLLPEASEAWLGRPGLAGHRPDGTDWSTAFAARAVDFDGDRSVVVVHAADGAAGLELRTDVETVAGGGLRLRHTLTNRRATPYAVDALDVVVPLPDRAVELLDLTGRWGRERVPQRQRPGDGGWLREGRTGKTGPDSPTLLVAGTPDFGFGRGEVWGLHVAWSGNSRYAYERQPSGLRTMIGGEVLLPGEVVLAEGESYTTPWVHVGAATAGLDALAAQLHGYLRALPTHPSRPRPVNCNVWEAVYFDHDLDRLRHLADLAAAIGVERYVLDDGWFGARRDDTAGLGDWVVSPEVWPDGLDPLIEHVRSLGMRFGLWFEPEMVNPDSDLYRAHPDWILATGTRLPELFRHQQVLDLGRPEVRAYLLDAIDRILSRHAIDYVKWDHNRYLVDAGSAPRGGAAGVHAATAGFYALLDELRRRHPHVEWESCSSGGGRIDLAVLERTERVWVSDMTDALARQVIQRWTAQLIPAEYAGAHVSAPRNHQTGRKLSLDFRAATAFFGDFGVEWDITSATEDERGALAGWIAAYKAHRELLHTGRLVRVDTDDDVFWIHGVVAADRVEALVAYVQLDEAVHDPVPFVVPGLDPTRRYRARAVGSTPVEWSGESMELTGAVLAAVGLPTPSRQAASVLVVHLTAVDN